MLRAVRFAARFAFRLDEATRAAIATMADQMTIVSAERIAQEMRAILLHPNRAEGIDLCRRVGLLAVILPEARWTSNVGRSTLDVHHETPNVQRPTSNVQHRTAGADCIAFSETGAPKPESFFHTLDVLRRLSQPSFALALAALLHALRPAPSEAAAVAETVGRRWRLSNDEIDRAVWLVRRQRDLREARAMAWPRLQRLLITDGIQELLDFHAADLAALGRDADPVDYCRQLLARPSQELDPPPLITGHDLIRHGVPRGKVYQALLDRVRDAQLERSIDSPPAALALVDQLRSAGDVAPSAHVWRD
jgi:poly(A) polymerase